jgi:hypothetical protein
MEALDLIKEIQKLVEEKGEIVSPIMYDPIKLQYKVSIAVMEDCEKGTIKRFSITVDDLKPRNFVDI